MDIALVTGASSGLGAEFARALAEQGKVDEIWAIARRKERFAKLAVECAPACIRPIPLDLTDRKSFAALRSLLEQERATICIIINNVGCCACGPFEKMPDREIESMIDLDVMGMALLDKTALPFMDRGSYAVLVGSVSSFVPVAGQAVYSAAKAYVRFHGQALRTELKKRGINVLVLSPGNMGTEMNTRGGEGEKAGSLPYLNVSKIARNSLDRASRGCSFYTPGWFFKGYRIVSKIVPHSIMVRATEGFF